MGAYILLVHGRIYINDLLLPSACQVHDLASHFDAGPTTDSSFRATAQRGSPPGTPEHYTAHPRISALFSVCLSSPDAINRSSAAHRPIMKYVPLPPLARLSDPYHTPLQLPIYSQRDYNQSRTSPAPRTRAQLAHRTSASFLPISPLIGASHDRLLSRRLCSHSPVLAF